MLDETLAQASRQAVGRFKAFVAVAIASLALAGLAIAQFAFDNGAETPANAKPTPALQEPAAQTAGRTNSPSGTPPGTIAPSGTDEDREAFKGLLAEYTSRLEPTLSSHGFALFDAIAAKQLANLKEQAISVFGAGDYAQARSLMDPLVSQAKARIQTFEAAVDEAVKKTQAALAQDDARQAEIHFAQANAFAPQSPEVQALASKVQNLPQVLKLVEKARLAKLQNDAAGEAAALREVVRLAPERTETAQRLAQLGQSRASQALAGYLQGVVAGIEADNPEAARASLEKARKLVPGRDEYSLLEKDLAALEKKHALVKLIGKASQAQSNDDWDGALAAYTQVRALDPALEAARVGGQRAQHIVALRQSITDAMKYPARLSTSHGEQNAQGLIQAAKENAEASPSLARMGLELEEHLRQYTTPVSIRVVSDGKTFVQVRGVGKIGQVTEKVIQLRPGHYTFEGKRDGYVSELAEVDIKPGSSDAEVQVVCRNGL